MKSYLFLFLTIFLFSNCKQDNKRAVTTETSSSQNVDKNQQQEKDLSQYGIKPSTNNSLGGLEVGDLAPDFELLMHDGNPESLSNLLVKSNVLLVFYRGHWCPICNRHLSALQDDYQLLKEKGIEIYAITPEKGEYASAMKDELEMSFPVFIDAEHEVMKQYKVFFGVTDEYVSKIEKHKEKNIAEVNGDDNPYLPIPATYLIGQDGKIKYAHYDPNYKSRSTVKEILQAL